MIFRKKLNERFHIEVELEFTRSMAGSEPTFREPTIRIVNTSNGEPIPDDEPKFLVRGRDHLATWLLARFQTLCVEDGCRLIADFIRFRDEHPERMKQPGSTRGL